MTNLISNFDRNSELNQGFETDHIKLLYYDLPSGFQDTYRSYDAPRFCTIVSGQKQVKINASEEICYDSSSFILLPPHAKVDMYMPQHTKAIVMEINPHTADQIAQKVSSDLDCHVSKDLMRSACLNHGFSTRMTILHRRIQDILASDEGSKAFLTDLVSQELIYEVLKVRGSFELLTSQQNSSVVTAMRLMQQSPESIHSITDVANAFNMSPANFNAQFKKLTDKTPNEFLTLAKLEKAKSLLGTLSVTETAFELGYENISHFIRLFKGQYGMTPKRYQAL